MQRHLISQERQWVRSIFESADADRILHYIIIIASDALCKAHLRKRNQARPTGSKLTTEAEFDEITKYFVPPTSDESFLVKEYYADRQD